MSKSKLEILIYDKTGSELIVPYLGDFKFIILDIRDKKSLYFSRKSLLINYIVLKFLKFELRGFKKDFILFCIKKYNPKLIITYIDNDIDFYKLSEKLNIRTAFIQNGRRTKSFDIFGLIINRNNNIFKVDYQFVFNESMCKLYKSHIRGEQFVIGSFKSNNIPIQKSTNKSVLFLSSFSEFNENNYFGKNINGNKITFTQFYSAESKILETLNKWAENKNLKFDILPRLENSEQERDFFIRSTKNIFLNFIDRKKKSFQNSYVLIDEYDLIITIDSTLGYEAIARKKKVMFIPLRSNFIEDDSFNFSWPCEFEKNGPFWITDFDQEILINKLEYIYNIGQEEWHEKYDFINNQVMVYDHSNSFFKNKLNEIIKIN